MTDIRDRLTYANVLAAPLTLQEAIDTIDHLRADLERERKWVRTLEKCVMDNINQEWGQNDGENQPQQGR